MTLHSLPLFVRLAGRPVMLIGEGEAADAKRRLLTRAGAVVVGEDAEAALAIVALDAPEATVTRLRARGVLVNAVDRSDLCDFTLPAIVDRDPVIVAIGDRRRVCGPGGGAAAAAGGGVTRGVGGTGETLVRDAGGVAGTLFGGRRAAAGDRGDAGRGRPSRPPQPNHQPGGGRGPGGGRS